MQNLFVTLLLLALPTLVPAQFDFTTNSGPSPLTSPTIRVSSRS
jgi:hypothetical protein